MRITLKKESLLKSLQLVSSLAVKNEQFPVLSNLLLYGENNSFFIMGSDLEIELVRSVALKGLKFPAFSFTVPAKKLLDIWRSFPNDTLIILDIEKEKVIIRAQSCQFSLLTKQAALFPKIKPGINECEFKIKKSFLKSILEKTQFSMANQDVRYYLNGLLFRFLENELVAVATNGHRLAISKIINANNIENRKDILVPRKAVQELLKLLNEIPEDYFLDLAIDKQHLFISGEGFTFSVKLIAGEFPDYNAVFPRGNQKKAYVDIEILKQAVSRVAILSNEKHKGISFHIFEEKIVVVANNPEQECAEEEVPAQYQGDKFSIAFNSTYVLDILTVLNMGTLTIVFTQEKGSVLFMQEEEQIVSSKYIVMPLQI